MSRARPGRVGEVFGWRGWRGGAAAAALIAAIAVTGAAGVVAGPRADAATTGMPMVTGAAGGPAARAAVRSAGSACGRAAGPFRVSGTQVLDAGGQPFVSYGLTVPGLNGPNWTSYVRLDLQKIAVAASDWCANTVRLQLDQDSLLGPRGTEFNQLYLAAIETEVSQAEQYKLVVVLNDETNFSAPAARNSERAPTAVTELFWKDLAKVYGNDPQVIFDLFNEPRTYSPGMSQAQEWHLWLDGGTYGGATYPFGMAALARYVRNTAGAGNLFWIEGPNWSTSFAGIVQQGALLHVSGVVYALHHPAGQPGPAAWDADFGYLAAGGVAPVVDGEWTNYEPAPSARPTPQPSSCWSDAPTSVPAFLQYLARHGIGLNAYQLQPGYLIRSYSNLTLPTTINPKTWTCRSDSERQPGQGAGSEVLAWFQQQNG